MWRICSIILGLVSVACQLSGTQPATVSQTTSFDFDCQGLNNFSRLCWSVSGRDQDIFYIVDPSQPQPSDIPSFLRSMQTTSSPFVKFDDLRQINQRLQEKWPDSKYFAVKELFPKFLAENFNRIVKFRGPNCYNTVLIVSGFIPDHARFAVSVEEFLGYLDAFYLEAQTPAQFGDIVLYNATTSKDHTAYYLFNDIVFHKLGFDRQYRYRLDKLDEVFKPNTELGADISPGALSFSLGPEDLRKNIRIFRRHNKKRSLDLSAEEQAFIDLVQFLSQEIWAHAAKRDLHETVGLSAENLFDDLIATKKAFETSLSHDVRLAYLRLISLKHQVFLSFEDEVYTSPLLNLEKLRREHCVHDNDFTSQLLQHLFRLDFQRLANAVELSRMQQHLRDQDRLSCNIRYLNLPKFGVKT